MTDRCSACGDPAAFAHDHKPDLSGLDDGPPLKGARRRAAPKLRAELADIRARAWATRRRVYGERGHG